MDGANVDKRWKRLTVEENGVVVKNRIRQYVRTFSPSPSPFSETPPASQAPSGPKTLVIAPSETSIKPLILPSNHPSPKAGIFAPSAPAFLMREHVELMRLVLVVGGAIALVGTLVGRRRSRRKGSSLPGDESDAASAPLPDAVAEAPISTPEDAVPSPAISSPEGSLSPMHIGARASIFSTPIMEKGEEPSGVNWLTYADEVTPPTGLSRLRRRSEGEDSWNRGGWGRRDAVLKLRNELGSREETIQEMQAQMRALELLSNRQVARCGELEKGEASAQKARNAAMRGNVEVGEELKRVGRKVEGLGREKDELVEANRRLAVEVGKGQKRVEAVGGNVRELEERNEQLEREVRELGKYKPLQERQVASLERNLTAAVERQQEAEGELEEAVLRAQEANRLRQEAEEGERKAERREREVAEAAERVREEREREEEERDRVEEEVRELKMGWEKLKVETGAAAREAEADKKRMLETIKDLKWALALQPEGKESRGSESKNPAPPVGKPTPANAGTGTLNPRARRPLWAYKEGREGGGRGGLPDVTPLKGVLKGSPANKALPAKAMGGRGAPGEEGGEGGMAGRNPGASGEGSTERRHEEPMADNRPRPPSTPTRTPDQVAAPESGRTTPLAADNGRPVVWRENIASEFYEDAVSDALTPHKAEDGMGTGMGREADLTRLAEQLESLNSQSKGELSRGTRSGALQQKRVAFKEGGAHEGGGRDGEVGNRYSKGRVAQQNGYRMGGSESGSDGGLDDLLDTALDDMVQVCSADSTPAKVQPGKGDT